MHTKYDRKTILPAPSVSVVSTDVFTLHDQRMKWSPSLARDYGVLQPTNWNQTMVEIGTTAHRTLSIGISYWICLVSVNDKYDAELITEVITVSRLRSTQIPINDPLQPTVPYCPCPVFMYRRRDPLRVTVPHLRGSPFPDSHT